MLMHSRPTDSRRAADHQPRIASCLPAPAFPSTRKSPSPINCGQKRRFQRLMAVRRLLRSIQASRRGILCTDRFIAELFRFVATTNIWRITPPHPDADGALPLSCFSIHHSALSEVRRLLSPAIYCRRQWPLAQVPISSPRSRCCSLD